MQVRSTRTRRLAVVTATVAASAIASTVSAGDRSWTTDADFAAGTSTDLAIGGDAITVATEGVGAPDPTISWWDAAWGQRRCIDVTNPGADTLAEFQIALEIDTATPIAGGRMDAAGDDLRFIAADGVTELDYWIDGPINTAATTIWVQTDTLPAGVSTICMYHDNAAAPAASDPFAPFTYSTPQDLYVAVSETQAGQPIAVTSYVANNTISDGITSVTLGVGGTHTFPAAGHTASTVVSATGPIAVQGTGNNGDSYVPLAFAGTEFVLPSQRNSNRVSLYAPFATANVTIVHSGTTTTVTVPANTSVSTAADVTSGADAAIVTSDQPVLVTHQASGNYDAVVALPASDAGLYGIRSTVHITGFVAAGSATVDESNGTSTTIAAGAAGAVSRGGGGGRGSGPAVLTTPLSGGPIGAIQQADNDGVESTAYWPRSELNVVYRTPVTIDYAAFACPTQRTGNLASDGTTLDCTGIGGAGFPGKALDSSGATAGALFESLDGTPFYVYAEDDAHDDENNILGPKQARLASPTPPTTVVGPEESRFEAAATWTSDAHDTGCTAFFEQLRWNPTSQPAGTDVRFQVATAPTAAGPFTFLGPDGTATSDYTAATGTPVAAVHDGDRFVQVNATLASSTDRLSAPTVIDVTVDWVGAAEIGGTLFADLDGDGANGGGDPGLAGIDVTLWRDDGDGLFDAGTDTDLETVASGPGGTWQFAEHPAGTFFVVADESQLPDGYATPATTTNPFGPVTIGECASTDVQIGWQPVGSIAVNVFSDLDGDGSLDTADVGLAGIDIGVWLDDGDGSFDPFADRRVAVLVTDANGDVTATGLAVGDYFVFVAAADEPAGHRSPATTPNPAGPITLAAGDDATAAIGFEPVGAIAGIAFVDDDGDGVRQPGEDGVNPLVVDIHLDDGDGVFDPATDTIVATVRTSDDGTYLASGLGPGDYWVAPFDPPAPLVPVDPIAATVSGSAPTTVDIPFGRAGGISGVVAFDEDGVIDSTSVPVPGITVTLHLDDGDGVFDPATDTQVRIALTNAFGAFDFTDVPDGDYFVQVRPSPLLGGGGPTLVTPNPQGPVEPGTGDLVFAFDPTSVILPETGATMALDVLRFGAITLLTGLTLLGAGRRRRRLRPAG